MFALIVLGAFYLWRGPIELHGKPTGSLIERFTVVQRVVHWTVAITFVALAVTGLILTFGKAVLLPLIGYTLFSWLATLSKTLHNFVGPVLIVALPILIAAVHPRRTFSTAATGCGSRNSAACCPASTFPADKSNAGEKFALLAMVVLLGLTLCVTGLFLDFPNFDQTRQTMQRANIIHMIAGLLAICCWPAHLSRHDRHARRVRSDALRLRRRDVGEGAPRILVQRRRLREGIPGHGAGRIDAAAASARRRHTQSPGGEMTTLRALLAAGLVVTSFGIAVAKLPPAPPMDDKAKAAAEEKKAKDAAAAEAAKAQQAKAEDRVAARYIAEQKAKGKTVTPQMAPTVTAAAAPGKPAAPAKGATAAAPAKK